VEQLRITCGLQPARLSKFEAGLLALGEELPGAPDLGPTDISATSTMGDLAFAVLRRQLAVLRAKEPGTRLGEDPEELHDMRVATRRLRAALSLFQSVLPVRAQMFREELGWLARLLGAVRDLDVQLEGLADMSGRDVDPAIGPAHNSSGPFAELAALLEREREAARTDMLNGLDSVRWDRLAKGLTAMAQQGPAASLRSPPGCRLKSACPNWCWRVTTRSARRRRGPSGPEPCRTSTPCASVASDSATPLSSAARCTEGRRPASCARSPCSRTSSAPCRMPKWRPLQLAALATGDPTCPSPPSS